MPAFLTHMIMANGTLARIENERVKSLISSNLAAYHSGAQGGDYFYLYKYYSMWLGHTYKMFGYALHRARLQRFFTESAQYIKNSGSDTLASFFYGYITHYYLDMLLHPAINAVAPDAMGNHNTLEYAIDTVYARENGIDAMEFDRAAFVHETTVKDGSISRFFEHIKKELYYGFRLKPHAYETCYAYFESYNRKMYKPDEKQLKWMKFQNKFTMLDLFTMLYHPYDEIKDLYDYAPYLELIEKAIKKSLELINNVDGYLHDERHISVIESFVFNVNCNGIPVIPREERKAFQRLYKKARLKLF